MHSFLAPVLFASTAYGLFGGTITRTYTTDGLKSLTAVKGDRSLLLEQSSSSLTVQYAEQTTFRGYTLTVDSSRSVHFVSSTPLPASSSKVIVPSYPAPSSSKVASSSATSSVPVVVTSSVPVVVTSSSSSAAPVGSSGHSSQTSHSSQAASSHSSLSQAPSEAPS